MHHEPPEEPLFAFSRAERVRLAVLYAVVVLLHVAGWGLYLHHVEAHPALLGLGLAAYLFGLRHAFDPDHIAAVDDSVRYLMHRGGQPLATGFFFSLGHSTVVLLLVVAVAFAAPMVQAHLPGLASVGHVVGAGISGVFLWTIGLLNLGVLLDLLRRRGRPATRTRAGLLGRLLGDRWRDVLARSWQMYPLGFLFGLGFDTASEIGLLAMTAGASAGGLPIGALLCLPLLFAAGMTMVDTTDGILMCRAYDWALARPGRRRIYNLSMTGLSVAVALGIGTLQLLSAFVDAFRLDGALAGWLDRVDFAFLGYAIAGLFLAGWLLSVAWSRRRPIAALDPTLRPVR